MNKTSDRTQQRSQSVPGNAMPVQKFWDRYTEALRAEGFGEKEVEWCKKHVESYLRYTGDVRLRDQVGEDVAHYIAVWFQKTNPSEFVLAQKVDAIRALFQKIVKAAWAESFPWAKWKEPHLNFPDQMERYSGEELEWRPVIRKESFRDELRGFKGREMYAKYFDKLRTEIRKKHYSIRTERTYEEWVARFIVFNDYKDPVLLCARNVNEYLGYLANVRRVAASTQNQAA